MGGATERESAGHGPLRCARCGEIIGVYEPLIHLADGIARKSSRAAEPDLVHAERGTCYHLACSELDGTGLA